MFNNRLIRIAIILLLIVAIKNVTKLFPYTYQVKTCLIPVESGNDMLSDTFVGILIDNQDHPTVHNRLMIDSLATYYEFNNQVSLINIDKPWGASLHTFSTDKVNRIEHDGYTVYQFDHTDSLYGLPVIRVTSEIPVKPHYRWNPGTTINYHSLTCETATWPVNNPVIEQLQSSITQGKKSERQKVLAILKWVNKNIKSSVQEGTRYGVIETLNQKNGRCWDRSDVVITLCRASGIPARQVMGIVYKKGGHAWSQVYIKGKGWVSVDSSLKSLDVSNAYIPLSITENGNASFLYASKPVVTRKWTWL